MPPEPSPQLTRARELRQTPTRAESILWQNLRARQLMDAKFRRQMPIGPYYADFACPAARCVIEVDGSTHETKEAYDKQRDQYINQDGWRILRIREADVINDIQSVLEAIALLIEGKL